MVGEGTAALFGRALILLVAGASVAMLANLWRDEALPLTLYQPSGSCETPAGVRAPELLSANAVAGACAHDAALIADTRGAEAFARGHVEGAVHLPCSASDDRATELLTALGDRQLLVVYGEDAGGALGVATSIAGRAADPDLRVLVIDGGFEAWSDAMLACASGACEGCSGDDHVH